MGHRSFIISCSRTIRSGDIRIGIRVRHVLSVAQVTVYIICPPRLVHVSRLPASVARVCDLLNEVSPSRLLQSYKSTVYRYSHHTAWAFAYNSGCQCLTKNTSGEFTTRRHNHDGILPHCHLVSAIARYARLKPVAKTFYNFSTNALFPYRSHYR